MSLVCITASIYVDTGGRDPEAVCLSMAQGLEAALGHFPDDEVVLAAVESAHDVTPEEIKEKGLDDT